MQRWHNEIAALRAAGHLTLLREEKARASAKSSMRALADAARAERGDDDDIAASAAAVVDALVAAGKRAVVVRIWQSTPPAFERRYFEYVDVASGAVLAIMGFAVSTEAVLRETSRPGVFALEGDAALLQRRAANWPFRVEVVLQHDWSSGRPPDDRVFRPHLVLWPALGLRFSEDGGFDGRRVFVSMRFDRRRWPLPGT